MPMLKTPTGERFYVEKQGEHPIPLLLIHGAAATHSDWGAEVRRLSGHSVLAIDLPGHGRSDAPVRQSVIAYADSVREFMDQLNLNAVYVAGHSMGGAIAQTLALHLPDRVRGLILVGTGAKLPVNSYILENALTNYDEVVSKISRWSWAENAPEEAYLRHIQQMLMAGPQVLYNDYSACNEFNIENQLAEITQPTLVVCGMEDKMTPMAWSKTLVAGIPRSKLAQIDSAGHMLPLERPQALATVMTNWFTTL